MICKAKEEGFFAYPTKKKIVPVREEKWLVKTFENRVEMKQRKGKFLHGLWSFEKVEEGYLERESLGEVTETYTHFKLIATLYHDRATNSKELFSREEIESLALSGVDKKVIKLLEIKKIL